MKKYKQLLFILSIMIFIFSFNVHRIYADEELTPSNIKSYNFYDYVIDSYDVHMIVNEDNTFDITETITAYFNKARHGIIRSIPLKNTVERLDGTTSKNIAYVKDVSVNNEYTILKQNDRYEIQIGSANRTVKGKQTYVINYQYGIGNDPSKEYDELYFNIIGNEWDTVIGNITFTIEMPKEFDESKLGFSAENVGSTNSENISYIVDGTKITGSYQGILRPGQALTVRCELTEGYFTKSLWNRFLLFWYENYTIILPLISLIICVGLLIRDKLKYPIVKTVEFYPPEGLNSLYVGFLYHKKAKAKDVVSLLVYLANKGYLKIRKEVNNNFLFIKLKDYNGNDENERLFLKGLFKKGKIVTCKDLYNEFYITEEKIISRINKEENHSKIFGSNKQILITSLVLFLIFLVIICSMDEDIIKASGLILFPIIEYCLVKGFYLRFDMDIALKNLFFCLLCFAGIVLLPKILIPLLNGEAFSKVLPIGTYILTIAFLGTIIPVKSQQARNLLGKVLGFKNFLKIARKEELEDMVMQNPNYFYDILPYAYVLGVSNKWIKKFEIISMKEPEWSDSNTFSVGDSRRLYSSSSRAMRFGSGIASSSKSSSSSSSYGRSSYSSSYSSSSSSSHSSGGGSSGRGSGGGGGRSW